MKHITHWRPDTCGCALEYEWDDALPEATREHRFMAASRACEHHSALPPAERYGTVVAENRSKNFALKEILDVAPRLRAQPDPRGGGQGLDQKYEFVWEFSGTGNERSLVVGVTGADLTPPEQIAIASRLEMLNQGKVVRLR